MVITTAPFHPTCSVRLYTTHYLYTQPVNLTQRTTEQILHQFEISWRCVINPFNAELNPICHLLALLGAHHILHGSRVRVKYLYHYLG